MPADCSVQYRFSLYNWITPHTGICHAYFPYSQWLTSWGNNHSWICLSIARAAFNLMGWAADRCNTAASKFSMSLEHHAKPLRNVSRCSKEALLSSTAPWTHKICCSAASLSTVYVPSNLLTRLKNCKSVWGHWSNNTWLSLRLTMILKCPDSAKTSTFMLK